MLIPLSSCRMAEGQDRRLRRGRDKARLVPHSPGEALSRVCPVLSPESLTQAPGAHEAQAQVKQRGGLWQTLG